MAEHSFHTPLPLTLDVGIPAGDIEIETVDGEESTVIVDGHERLVAETEVTYSGDRLSVAFRGKKPFGISIAIGDFSLLGGSSRLRVVARVPHGASVQTKGASTDVRVTGRLDALEIASVSGDLKVNGEIAGDAKVKTVSGDARLERIGGNLSLQSVSGDLRVGPVGGSAETKTVSGDIRIGAVAAGDVRFTSVSGDVEIGIAQGSAVDVDAGSTSGDLSSEVPLGSEPVPGDASNGSPTVVVRGRTVSGDVRVFRAA